MPAGVGIDHALEDIFWGPGQAPVRAEALVRAERQRLLSTVSHYAGVSRGVVRALVDHLGIARADLIGYSMGARICAYLAAHEAAWVRSAVLAGVGLSLVRGRALSEAIAAALEAPSLADVTDPTGRMFRTFAEQTHSDLRALAACIRGSSERLSRADAAAIKVPVLIAAGTTDDVAGPVRPLAELIPGAQVLEIPGRDHMRSVGDRAFKEGTLAFLAARP